MPANKPVVRAKKVKTAHFRSIAVNNTNLYSVLKKPSVGSSLNKNLGK